MPAPTFNTADGDDLVKAINRGMTPDKFWGNHKNKYFSVSSIEKGAEAVEITMTRAQWNELLAEGFNRG